MLTIAPVVIACVKYLLLYNVLVLAEIKCFVFFFVLLYLRNSYYHQKFINISMIKYFNIQLK